MAIEEVKTSTLANVSTTLSSIASRVSDAVGKLERANIPWVPMHSTTIISRRIPELLKFCSTLESVTLNQIELVKLGIESQGSMEKKIYERRKEREATKPKKSDRKGRKETKGQ